MKKDIRLNLERKKRVKKRIDYAPYREKIEWANYWWDNAYEERKDRILLIGDSTSRAFRSTLAQYLKRPVDFMGSSSTVTDELFIKELETFLSVKEYSYDAVHVQLGSHGIVAEGGQKLPQDYYDYYAASYEDMVCFLKEKCEKIVLATATQVIISKKIKSPILKRLYAHFHTKKSEHIDEQFEAGIQIRNKIVCDIAKKHGLEVNDLYRYMNQEGSKFRHIDHIHYEKKAKMFIAKRVADYLLREENDT